MLTARLERQQDTQTTPQNAEDKRRSFEEWLKLSADNKINISNTWNLALIDYFTDMSLLKAGDSINFQKASCTLDGCVKIYTSRIDSVDAETKKLLNGLFERDEVESQEIIEGQPTLKTTRKKRQANTIESDVDLLNTKHLDLDYAVDPLFRKTAADFDEGGAKGLLLNHLSIAPDGLILFDANSNQRQIEEQSNGDVASTVLLELFSRGFQDMQSKEICPTFSNFIFSLEGTDSFQLEPEDFSNYQSVPLQLDDLDDQQENYDDANDDDGFPIEERFEEVSQIWETKKSYVISQDVSDESEIKEMFAYFDKSIKKSWVGPEFWKSRISSESNAKSKPNIATKNTKSTASLDFTSPLLEDGDTLLKKSKTSINLPKTTLNSSDSHLLPQDYKFNMKNFTSLFLKQKGSVKLGTVQSVTKEFSQGVDSVDVFTPLIENEEVDTGPTNFDMGEDESVDGNDVGNESFPLNALDGVIVHQAIKGEPLNYAKKAKRVDVQKLKENLWQSLEPVSENIKFTTLINDLDGYYESTAKAEISVPYCFICLLHLANENNLIISNDSTENPLKELQINKVF